MSVTVALLICCVTSSCSRQVWDNGGWVVGDGVQVMGDGGRVMVDLRIPHVAPEHMDSYYCVPFKVPRGDSYIVNFQPEAHMHVVHHMFLIGCGTPYQESGYW